MEGRRGKLGELFGGDGPGVPGTIQRTIVGDADAWDSAADGAPERLVILGRGGEFNRQEGLSQARRKAVGDGKCIGKVCKVIVVLRIKLWQHEFSRFEVLVERIEQLGQAAVSDLPQNR